jgi:hypothetical protein
MFPKSRSWKGRKMSYQPPTITVGGMAWAIAPTDLDAIGPVCAEIFRRSNTEHTDLYLCLCDVTQDGAPPTSATDNQRLRPDRPSGRRTAAVVMRARSASNFGPLRIVSGAGIGYELSVASGAYPRYARNFGSGEPLGGAASMMVAHQHILHSPEHRSSITFAVVSG